MNRRILRLLLMGFLPFQVSAQLTDNILTTPTYRMGSYQRLDELRMNHPTLHPTLVKQAMIGKIKRYIVRYADSNKRVKREIYGFAQRDTLYVNSSNYGNGYHFVPILEVGGYCYLEDVITNSNAAAAGAVLGGAIGGALAGAIASGSNSLVLSLRDGKYYGLRKKVMRQLLADDAELLRRYEQERKPKQPSVMRQYVVAYNERHQHELPDFTTSLEAKVVIYRRDKKEREEAIVITSSDSTVAILHPNEYQELMIAPREMQFCSGTTCVTITPSTQRTNYLKCSFPRKDAEASLEEVETKVGSFYVRQIGYKQAKQ